MADGPYCVGTSGVTVVRHSADGRVQAGMATRGAGIDAAFWRDRLNEAYQIGACNERDAICKLLKSGAASTRAERAIDEISKRMEELPPWLAGLIADWLDATADELAEYQKQIRARGEKGARR